MKNRIYATILLIIPVTMSITATANAQDTCPVTAQCGNNMPTVTVAIPVATNGSATVTNNTTVAQVPSQASVPVATTTVGKVSTEISPTVPLNVATSPVPTIAIPSLPAAQGNVQAQVPVIAVPKMTWDAAPAIIPVAPTSPVTPTVTKVQVTKPKTATQRVVEPVVAEPIAATPIVSTGTNHSLPWGAILFILAGGAIGAAGRATWDGIGAKVKAVKTK